MTQVRSRRGGRRRGRGRTRAEGLVLVAAAEVPELDEVGARGRDGRARPGRPRRAARGVHADRAPRTGASARGPRGRSPAWTFRTRCRRRRRRGRGAHARGRATTPWSAADPTGVARAPRVGASGSSELRSVVAPARRVSAHAATDCGREGDDERFRSAESPRAAQGSARVPRALRPSPGSAESTSSSSFGTSTGARTRPALACAARGVVDLLPVAAPCSTRRAPSKLRARRRPVRGRGRGRRRHGIARGVRRVRRGRARRRAVVAALAACAAASTAFPSRALLATPPRRPPRRRPRPTPPRSPPRSCAASRWSRAPRSATRALGERRAPPAGPAHPLARCLGAAPAPALTALSPPPERTPRSVEARTRPRALAGVDRDDSPGRPSRTVWTPSFLRHALLADALRSAEPRRRAARPSRMRLRRRLLLRRARGRRSRTHPPGPSRATRRRAPRRECLRAVPRVARAGHGCGRRARRRRPATPPSSRRVEPGSSSRWRFPRSASAAGLGARRTRARRSTRPTPRAAHHGRGASRDGARSRPFARVRSRGARGGAQTSREGGGRGVATGARATRRRWRRRRPSRAPRARSRRQPRRGLIGRRTPVRARGAPAAARSRREPPSPAALLAARLARAPERRPRVRRSRRGRRRWVY